MSSIQFPFQQTSSVGTVGVWLRVWVGARRGRVVRSFPVESLPRDLPCRSQDDFVPNPKADFQTMILDADLVMLAGGEIARSHHESQPAPSVLVNRGAIPLARETI